MRTKRNIAIVAIIALTSGLLAATWSDASISGDDVEYQALTAEAPKAFEIPPFPPLLWEMLPSVEGPNDIDQATWELGAHASLLNFYLATPIDLAKIGLGQGVHIPVQITRDPGGRKSLYFLERGEEVLSGIYVTNNGLALSYVKRETGGIVPAKDGDIFSMRMTTREGLTVFEGHGALEIVNLPYGVGQFRIYPGPYKECCEDEEEEEALYAYVWVLWSCIKVAW